MKAPRPPRERESKVQRSVIVRLRRLGVVLFRRNVGAMTDPRGNFVRFAAPGQSDLYGLLPASHGGTHVEIEIKSRGNKPTEHQLRWLKEMTARGAVAFWVDNPDSAERIMEAILRGGQIEWHANEDYDVRMPRSRGAL